MKKRLVCWVPLLGAALILGMASPAFAQLGACADPLDGTNCTLNQSAATCEAAGGVWQGAGTTACRDCDCDSNDDAAELEALVLACIGLGGTREACTTTYSSNGAADGLPSTCPGFPYSSGDWCCAPADGSWTQISDAWACSDDVCNADGSVTHTADDSYCTGIYTSPPECHIVLCTMTAGDGCEFVDGPAGVDCGLAALGPCDLQDTCDDAGVCIDNRVAAGVECRADDGSGCDVAEVCAGGRYCPADAKQPDGTACPGVPLAGPCDAPDSCCSGVCVDIVANDGATTECRAAVDVCDVAEYCAGGASGCGFGNINNGAASVECPADAFASTTTNCGNAALGVCDLQDRCDGAGACVDRRRGTGYECRASVDAECDPAENCDGGIDCPADVHEPVGTACGNPDDTLCNAPDTCGAAGTCVNRVDANGTVCRASTDADCDPAEVCAVGVDLGDGENPEWDGVLPWVPCPADAHAAGGTPCTDDGDECTNDRCSYSPTGFCYHSAAEADGWACGDQTDTDCDDPDTCSGGACLDNFLADSFANVCDDGDACTADDHCDGAGGCHGGTAAHGYGTDTDCDDGVYCTNDLCDPDTGCYSTLAGGPCPNLLTTFVAHASPDPLTDSLNSGCFVVDIMVADASDVPTGVNCAYLDVVLGDAACPLTVTDVAMNDALFPELQSVYVEPPYDVLDLGGCTVEGGVGAGEYVLLAQLAIKAPEDECTASITIGQSTYTLSSLIGAGATTPAVFDSGSSSGPITMHCVGTLYDHAAAWDFVNAADLSLFATGWPPNAYDAEFDYDLDGVVGPGDLSFIGSAFEKHTCAGGILLPCEQTNCGCAYGMNAWMVDEHGHSEPVMVPWASKETIESFGLQVPSKNWEGWGKAPRPIGDRERPTSVEKRSSIR
jgi:hypothetical protein